MDGPSASILVVCNPHDAAELLGSLEGEVALPGGGGGVSLAVVTTDGGDDTVARFIEHRPEVVVVSASLDAGDPRALIAALRDAAPAGTFHVVLVGDRTGPIRNALDAVDFASDRFVARPVSAKALRFAVGSGVVAARRGRAARPASTAGDAAPVTVLPDATPGPTVRVSGTHRAVMVFGRGSTPPPAAAEAPRARAQTSRLDAMLDAAVDDVSKEEVVRRTSGGFAIPVEAILAAGGTLDEPPPSPAATPPPGAPVVAAVVAPVAVDAAVTTPTPVHDVPTRPVGALEQRRIHATDPEAGGALATPATVTIQPRRNHTRPRFGLTFADPPPPAWSRRGTTPPPPPPRRDPTKLPPDSDTAATIDEVDVLVEQLDPVPPPAEAAAPEAAAAADDTGGHELPPGLEAPVVRETAGSFDESPSAEPPRDEPPSAASPGWPEAAEGTAELPKDDDWDAPPLPTREPTLILSDGAVAAPVPAQLDVTERTRDGRWSSAPSVAPVDDPEEPAAAAPAAAADPDDEVVEDHLDADLSDLSISRPVPAPPPPTGGDFARELRRKMSEMAQRLFRGVPGAATGAGAASAPPAVDVRPPHDFRTEIDLAAIDAAAPGGTEVYGLDVDPTFAGLPTSPGLAADTPHPGAPGTTTTSPRTSESGEIVRGSTDAPTLIARMFASEVTGKIVFRRDDVEKVIFFDGGRPVFASSTLPADRMGELLYREGKITAEQYAGCRDLVMESGRRMGEILVDRGYLKRRELLPAVRRHVEDIIYSLFAWDTGEYRILPGDGAREERIRLSRHPAAMVLEGIRRKLDQPALERLLGPATTVVEVADRDKAGTVIAVADLSPDERAALAGMDGSADLAHVARTCGAGLTAVYQLAWAMTLLGVATVRRRGVEDDDAPALVGETDLAIDRERVRARHRLVAEADYFALLGVRRDATAFEIRRAYEAARRDFDADAFPPELRTELGVELAEIGAVLDEAYHVLRDDRLRGEYLAHLAE